MNLSNFVYDVCRINMLPKLNYKELTKNAIKKQSRRKKPYRSK